MKKLILISALLLVASNGWAYSETDLIKLKAINACEGCDLSVANLTGENLGGANLNDANLSGADLRKANIRRADLRGVDLREANLVGADLKNIDLTTTKLKNAKLDAAKFCKTKMPWGEVNDDCQERTKETSKIRSNELTHIDANV